MIGLDQWRASIGCFNPRPHKKGSTLHGLVISNPPLKVMNLILVLACLMAQANDVETNPGPPKNNKPTRQSTLTSLTFSPNDACQSPKQTSSKEPSNADLMQVLTNLNMKFDRVDKTINDLDVKLKALAVDNERIQVKFDSVVNENVLLKKSNQDLCQRLDLLEAKLEDQEGRSRRNNLIFHGIEKSRNEKDCVAVLKQSLAELNIDTSNMEWDRVHRLGTSERAPIIARFTFYNQRAKVISQMRAAKNKTIHFSEDFTKKVREKRKELSPFLRDLRSQGKRATMVYDHLLVDGIRYYDVDQSTETPSLIPDTRYSGPNHPNSTQRSRKTTPNLTPSDVHTSS